MGGTTTPRSIYARRRGGKRLSSFNAYETPRGPPDPPPDLPSLRSPSPLQGEGRGGGRGARGVGRYVREVHHRIPARGRPQARVRAGPPSYVRTPLPTSPLPGRRSMNGNPRPPVLPPSCRGRVGVGVAPGGWGDTFERSITESRRGAVRKRAFVRGLLLTSGPPSRPPPCQGGGVYMAYMASPRPRAGRDVAAAGGYIWRIWRLRPPFFSLPLAGGGSGWGSRQGGGAIRSRGPSPNPGAGPSASARSCGASFLRPDPPPDLPPARGEEYQWSGGERGAMRPTPRAGR